jgi:stage V sporulation protein R
MPVGYHHWSFGKQFLATEQAYKRGQMGLAYEIVINSNPCIAYLMEENTLTMQALVMAHACYGHNSFFKGNYLFRTWTSADAIIDYLVFARNYIAECEERHGEDAVELLLDSCHALMNYGVDRYKRPQPLSRPRRRRARSRARGLPAGQVNDLWRTIPQMLAEPDAEEDPLGLSGAASRPSPRRTCSTSSRRTRRCWSPGSARWCASCASSRSTSTPSARPR